MAKRQRHDSSLTSTPPSDNPTQLSPDIPIDHDRPGSPSSSSDHSTIATSKKYNRLDPKLTPHRPPTPPLIYCNFLPSCNKRPFSSYAEFESHYHQQHTNRCQECQRNFPSERYLMIHIAENHDVFNELKKERGEKTFQCFVDGCERLCSTPQKRRLHVIDKHGFPRDFYFRVVDYGIDHCNSLIRPSRRYSKSSQGTADTPMPSSPERTRRGSKNEKNTPKTDQGSSTKEYEMKDVDEPALAPAENKPIASKRVAPVTNKEKPVKDQEAKTEEAVDTDKEMQDVTDLMASVKLVPRQIRFGRRGGGMVGFGTRK